MIRRRRRGGIHVKHLRLELMIALAIVLTGPVTAGADDCHTVVRVFFSDRAQLQDIAGWTEPWEVDHDAGHLVVDVDDRGMARLLAGGYRVEVDERLTRMLCAPRTLLKGQTEGIPGYPCYRTVEETFTAAQTIVADHPTLAQWIDVGDSWEKTQPGGSPGYDMQVLILSNINHPGTPTGDVPPHGKPRLFVTSAIHAREYTTAELMIRFAEQLVAGYGIDPEATWLLDEHEIHLLLHTNPDGRKHAESGLSWRKNTNENYCSPTSNDRGADLNRNFEFQWACCGGSSGYECDPTYRGPAAASEPEVQTVEAYARSIFPDQRDPGLGSAAPEDATGVYMDIHSYGRLVMWPWGFTSSTPPNSDALRALGRRLAWFNGYEPDQAIGLYPTDGTTVDFAYGDLGAAALLFELGTTFFQDCGSFESTILPDNLRSLRYAARVARTPYLTPSGPDAVEIDLGGVTVVSPGEPVSLSALLDDTRFNNLNGAEPVQNITESSYTVDAPPWQDGAAPAAMSPADGAFDTPTEWATATVPTNGLDEGRHTLFVQGRDASGIRGPVGAAFFWILDPATAPRIAGTVVDAVTGQPLAATVSAGPFSTASDPVDGSYELMAAAGSYDVTAVADGYAPVTAVQIPASPEATTPLDFRLAPFTQFLEDDVEGGDAGWTAQPPWAITDEASSSPTHSWTDSPGGDYANDRNVSLTSPTLDLSGATGVTLQFDHVYDIEDGWDFGYVEFTTDGGAGWSTAATYSGVQGTWQTVTIPLSELDGSSSARVRFRLETDSWVTEDGWHVDDIIVRAGSGGSTSYIFMDGFESGSTTQWSAAVP
jgi:hypothetical protein